jgi:hypothetical protein
MVAPGVDDWLLLLLVVDRVMENFCLLSPMSRDRILEGFYGKKKMDSQVLGSFVVILTSCSIHEKLFPCRVAISQFE